MDKISVVINTLNEEKNLPRALASIKGFADEVVVVDMKSDDNTTQIATKFGAKVFEHPRAGYVEPARNYAISKTSGNWILILDADEELSADLKAEIARVIKSKEADYFRIPRKNFIFGKWIKHSRWWPDYNIRLFKQGCVSWSEVIHSVPMTTGIGKDFDDKEDLAIVHHHYETVEQYLDRLNRYTSEHAKNLVKEGYKFDWVDLIHKPSAEFLSRYFQGGGYRDGIHGLALSLLQSFSELTLYLKVWQLSGFTKSNPHIKDVVDELKNAESEVHYWEADTLLHEIGGLKHRIKRKLKIS
ncbi:MAG: Glycosyl transferase family 2 [Candidatus Woesebacteria bacterium GW2011_GWA1_39_8]|uniref:Glycosyl transferase family 2 n=1 Tax=Candidatus Woesebacteria bacterium GW2011_GWA1_39_8 TaxID=1618552 RepID=A0A0G0PI68_9BACT|nr:MAG: Glycosyl transferase family 2 [Candidatus Woesebacteria bacterium GW2011_GWA1_39_8]